MTLLEQQKEEMTQCRKELTSLRERSEVKSSAEEAVAATRVPKLTLQKLSPDDEVEHFLATFERITTQQDWPAKVWGKAMAAYASLGSEDAAKYSEVKKAILHRYDINDESHRRRFCQDRKRPEESYRNWGDRLRDHFRRWTKDQEMSLEELMVLDQFIHGVPEELGIWLRERKPKSLFPMQVGEYPVIAAWMEGHHIQRAFQPEEGRSRTNLRGDKRCFQCGRWGHLMYSCPNRKGSDATGATRALYTKTCDEVAWNVESHKYLRRRTSEGQPVQMLVDTGCEMTMVSAKLVDSTRVDPCRKVPVLCTHGDTMLYPTATVKLQTGPWERQSCVVVAPNLPVDALLGRDIYDLGQVKQNFAVMTKAQSRRMEQESEIPATGDPPPNPIDSLENQPSSSGDNDELRGEEEGVLVAETEEDPLVGGL